MSLITPSFHKSFFYFLLYWVFEASSTLIKERLDAIYTDHENVNLLFELLNLACINISDLLAGFFVLITYITSKSEKTDSIPENKNNNSALNSSLIYTDISKRKNKYKLILMASLCEFISRFIEFFFFVIFGIKRIRGGEITWLISFDFLARIVFSHFLLKTKIFIHHRITIILIIISLCSMSVCAFIVLDEKDSRNWPYFISLGLKFIILSLGDVLNKRLFNEKFLLPHTLMFLRGIFNACMFIILIPIIIIIKNNKSEKLFKFWNINEDKNMNIFIQIFLFILYIFFFSFKIFCLMKVIYIFSPQYVAFLNQVFYLFLLLRCRINAKDNTAIIITDVFCLFIIIFSTLVFNEIIILNFCGLNENTKEALKLRESQEIDNIKASLKNEEDVNNSKSSLEDSTILMKSDYEDFKENHEF